MTKIEAIDIGIIYIYNLIIIITNIAI